MAAFYVRMVEIETPRVKMTLNTGLTSVHCEQSSCARSARPVRQVCRGPGTGQPDSIMAGTNALPVPLSSPSLEPHEDSTHDSTRQHVQGERNVYSTCKPAGHAAPSVRAVWDETLPHAADPQTREFMPALAFAPQQVRSLLTLGCSPSYIMSGDD